MLRSLDIRDILIIDRLSLDFKSGLNVLTGETGAGKSILLDSLGFVLGWRGKAELVRQGAEQGEVVAEFDLPKNHPAFSVLNQAGIPCEDTLILRRVNTVQGRKTAWINDRKVSTEVLRNLSACLVELHGQFDDRGLLNPRGHLALLDEFANNAKALSQLRKLWGQLAETRKLLAVANADLAAIQAEEEFLRHAVAELDSLAPQVGEEAELDAKRRLMQGSERCRKDMAKAAMALGLEGVEGQVNDASRWLQAVEGETDGLLAAPIEALQQLADILGQAQQGLDTAIAAMSFNPADLELTEERLFAIRGLARKHAVTPDALGEFAKGLQQKLTNLDQGAGNIAALESQLHQQELQYADKADQLSKMRQKAASSLDKLMAAELAPLKMERAVFCTEISRTEAGPDGQDKVVFTAATNPGAPSGPLNKIASGGELSRFLLALKVCLTDQSLDITMIFDEIDRGVGGATADAVGKRLAELADGSQVLVVTHSPQVAARGQHHCRVEKYVKGGETRSNVVALDNDQRVDEIARMLSGDSITDAARQAAKSLLQTPD